MAERKLEKMNRIVIPKCIRDYLNITEDSIVMLTKYSDRLLVYKFENGIETYNNVFLTGITRTVDHLGRLTIPKEMIRALGMNVGDYADVNLEEDSCIFYIRPKNEYCAICGTKTDLISLREHLLCSSCLHALQEEFVQAYESGCSSCLRKIN